MVGTPFVYSNVLDVHEETLKLIDTWLKGVHSELPAIEPGSEFDNDSQRCPEAYPGFDAWDYLAQAVDHLGTIRIVLKSKTIPTHALYTLLRAAMENAAMSFWISGPNESDVRIARCLKLAHEDSRQAGDLLEHLPPGSWLGRTPKEKKAALTTAHKALGLPGYPGQRFGFRAIMKTVGEESGFNRLVQADRAHSSSRLKDPLVVYWTQCSGMTHGYSWARLGMLQTTQWPGTGEAPEAVKRARLNASVEDIMSLLEVSAIILDSAWEMHRARRSFEPPTGRENPYLRVGVLPAESTVTFEKPMKSADPLAFWRRQPDASK